MLGGKRHSPVTLKSLIPNLILHLRSTASKSIERIAGESTDWSCEPSQDIAVS